MTKNSFVGEEVSPRQQGTVQQGGAEAGGLEQVHGAGEESKGGFGLISEERLYPSLYRGRIFSELISKERYFPSAI